MGTLLRGLLAIGALACCALAGAVGPSGGSYAITSSTIASGTPGMTGSCGASFPP